MLEVDKAPRPRLYIKTPVSSFTIFSCHTWWVPARYLLGIIGENSKKSQQAFGKNETPTSVRIMLMKSPCTFYAC
jgi:hypothetical protein